MSIVLTGKQGIAKAVSILNSDGVLAIPTETVYGLAGLASSEIAIRKIYEIKNRPAINPLISHYASISEIKKDLIVNETAEKLLNKFSPGPLTLVLRKKQNSRISSLACAGLETAAVRIPNHELCLELLEQIAQPLVAPSANPSGRLSPISSDNVITLFDSTIEYVLDGGTSVVGIESTIVEVCDASVTILRYGAITIEDLLTVVSEVQVPEQDGVIKSPGMLLKHYSPKCRIKIGFDNLCTNEGLLGFGDIRTIKSSFSAVRNLSERGNLEEAAANFFKYIHELEELGVESISVMPIPDIGIGQAINDRLKRAVANFK